MKVRDKLDKILLVIFIFLLCTVVALEIIYLNKKDRISKQEKSNIVIPLLENNTINDKITINIEDLKKGKLMNYRFKIRNYREGIINKHELKYILKFEVGDNMDFKLYENNKFKNIKNNTLENILKAKTKEEYSYTIAITAKEDIKKGHMSFEIK